MDITLTYHQNPTWCFAPSRLKTNRQQVSVAIEQGRRLLQCEFAALYPHHQDWLLSFSRVPGGYDWGFHVTHYFAQQGIADVVYLERCDAQVLLLVMEHYQLLSEMQIAGDDLGDYLHFLGPEIARAPLVQSGLSKTLSAFGDTVPALIDKEVVSSPALTRLIPPDSAWRFQPIHQLLQQPESGRFCSGGEHKV
ncbi:MAG: hypothetical protein AAGB12_14875 [Pseudomonadota bacterium]